MFITCTKLFNNKQILYVTSNFSNNKFLLAAIAYIVYKIVITSKNRPSVENEVYI